NDRPAISMLAAHHLTKTYGPTLAVDDLSLELQRGQIVGFLGPNGAGKSTTIRMLTGFLPPTSGRATLDGHDVTTATTAARRKLGYLPESNPLYPEMRVDEYLHFCGQLHGMTRGARRARMDEVTDRCGLSALRRRTIGRLSKGNRQRVGLASALLHEPPVLVLDEPTSGLDPNQIGQVRGLIRELAGKHTVLLSSHILPEVQRVADRVVIIAQGKIVADGTVDELRRRSRSVGGVASLYVEAKGGADDLRTTLSGLDGVESVEVEPQQTDAGWSAVRVLPSAGHDCREAVAEHLRQHGHAVRELRSEAETLEEFFVRVTDTGRKAGAA
ncbi:MAG: ABC transporter ATP-binding protein, partial [Planctomycetota bacterium]